MNKSELKTIFNKNTNAIEQGAMKMRDVIQKINNPKPKGRPRKANKLIKMSITLTPAQMEWLEKTAIEKGIERSELLRDCVDMKMTLSNCSLLLK